MTSTGRSCSIRERCRHPAHVRERGGAPGAALNRTRQCGAGPTRGGVNVRLRFPGFESLSEPWRGSSAPAPTRSVQESGEQRALSSVRWFPNLVDSLDVKIIRTMGLRPYGDAPQVLDHLKPSYIGPQLGVEPETVKARLARMEEAGFIRFYQLYPNFQHLGLRASAYLFHVPDEDRKTEAIRRIEPVDGLVEIHNFLGAELCVDLSYRTPIELGKKLRLLSDFTGDPNPSLLYERHMPEVERALDRFDWRILKALRYRARRSLSEVADETNASVRTVRRRFERMAGEGSLFIVPAVDAAKAAGIVLYELLFYTTPGTERSTMSRILEAYADRYMYHYVPSSDVLGNFDVLLYAESTSEIETMRLRGRNVPGVAKVASLVFRGWTEYTDWIDAAIGDRAHGP
jgi:DNA-binding Lrp family transcriptional regulator